MALSPVSPKITSIHRYDPTNLILRDGIIVIIIIVILNVIGYRIFVISPTYPYLTCSPLLL